MTTVRIILLLCACMEARCAAAQPTDDFTPVLDRMATAMQDRDGATLHAMLDDKLTVGMTPDSLTADLERDHAEFAALADQIAHTSKVTFEATVKLADGKTLDLVKEGETWKLATTVVKITVPTDPVSVLAAFGLELGNMAAALKEAKVLAKQHQEGLLATISTLASEIAAVEAKDLVIAEDRCYVDLPSGHKIELVREPDGWKVSSVFPALEFR